MISEKQIKSQSFTINSETKINFDQTTNDSPVPTQFSKMKVAFRQKIRNRQLDKIKAQMRKVQQIHIAIENVLQTDFPKESNDAKNWANQLSQLYKQSTSYETDPHKLRQIFYLASRFPSLGTLRLFYFALLTTDRKNIRTLVDVDVWKFLHNILQDSTKNPVPSQNLPTNSQSLSFSPPSLNIAIDQGQLKMVKLTIETFVAMFDKDIAIRDYSIGVHSTYSSYLVYAYRKFRDHIRTEMIYFLRAALRQPPKQYKRDYLHVIRLTMGMISEYNQKIGLFMHQKQWVPQEMNETIQEAIPRIRTLFGVLCKAFEHAETKWLNEFLNKKDATFIFNYYENTYEFLTFGMWILGELVASKEYNKEFYELFGNMIEMMFNLFYFFMVMSEKTYETQPDDALLVKKIMGKVVLMLNFIKNCEQNKVFIHAEKDLLLEIEKTKQICLFSIGNGMDSELDSYQNFARNFIFYTDEEGNVINLLDLLAYLLNTVHYDLVLIDLVQVVFYLLEMDVPNGELQRFSCLPFLLQRIIEMMQDKVVTGGVKTNIATHLEEYFCEKFSKKSIGYFLGVENVLSRNINHVEDFMYSQNCSKEVFLTLENLMQFVNDLHKAQENVGSF